MMQTIWAGMAVAVLGGLWAGGCADGGGPESSSPSVVDAPSTAPSSDEGEAASGRDVSAQTENDAGSDSDGRGSVPDEMDSNHTAPVDAGPSDADASCVPPVPELSDLEFCNGSDDDCDGLVDEGCDVDSPWGDDGCAEHEEDCDGDVDEDSDEDYDEDSDEDYDEDSDEDYDE